MKSTRLTPVFASTIILSLSMTYNISASDMVLEGSVFGESINASVYAGRVATDDDQNVYIAGHTKGNLGLEGYGYGYNPSGFLMKFSKETEGAYEWARIFGSSSDDRAYGVDVDDDGNILASGTTYGSVAGQTNTGLQDAMLIKYTPEGSSLWTRVWGSTSNEHARHVAVDEENNSYVVGKTYGSFGGQTNTGDADIFVSKFSLDGSNLWTKIWGSGDSNAYDSAWDVDTDNDSVYIAGQTGGDVLDGQTNTYGYAAFLTKMDSAGNKEWTKIWGSGTGTTFIASLGVAADDEIIAVVGMTAGDIGDATNSGGLDAFIRIFDVDGEILFTDVWGSTADDYANDVTLDESVYVAGQTKGYFDENQALVTLGYGYGSSVAPNWNAFISEFEGEEDGEEKAEGEESSGARVWTRIWGSTNTDYATGIAVDDAGNIIIAGDTDGALHTREESGLVAAFATLWMWLDNASDYDGDGADDLTVFDDETGLWYTLSSGSTNILQWGTSWGWPGARPVAGDYNGDGINDLAVFDDESGDWYIMDINTNLISWAQRWGWPGAKPVSGDYDGDGIDDLAVFDDESGYWYITGLDGSVITWAQQWGWPGAQPVHGDFNGDDRDDLAVFDTENGYWYIIGANGTLINWAQQWGWPGAEPVPGDYDGDGSDDLAVFDTVGGHWYIMGANGSVITWAQQWGWPGADPVSGDYDGDGSDDLAIYDNENGYWYVMGVDGSIIIWGQQWGGTGVNPVAAD